MEYTEFCILAEKITERAKTVLQRDGHHSAVLLTLNRQDQVIAVDLTGDRSVSEQAREAIRQLEGYAAIIVGEGYFQGANPDGTLEPDKWNGLTLTCVHPDGRRLFVIPFAREHGVTFGRPIVMENFTGDAADILK